MSATETEGVALNGSDPERLAYGRGRFAADMAAEGLTHLAFVRSTVGHARVISVDVSAAKEAPDVIEVLTAADLQARGVGPLPGGRPVLAADMVCFQGQEVAVVVAETAYAAGDAAELIAVDYEPLEVMLGRAKRADGEGWDVDSAVVRAEAGDAEMVERAVADADLVVRMEATYPRSHPVPLECSGCVAVPDATTGTIRVSLTSETAEAHRSLLAAAAGLPENRLEIVSADLGGGFGGKEQLFPGHVATVVAADLTGRPVTWVETRSETHVATTAVGDCALVGEMALTSEGGLLGFDARLIADAGAYPGDDWPDLATAALEVVQGGYRFPAARLAVDRLPTNKSPISARPGGLPRTAEITFLVEQLLDKAASALGIDPRELRLMNLDATSEEGGVSPAEALRTAAEAVGYDDVRHEQERIRQLDDARVPGVGLTFCLDRAGVAGFAAAVRVDLRTGKWTVERVGVAHAWGPGLDVAVQGGLNQGFGLAAMQSMSFDEQGNCMGANFMDYLLPTSWEAPPWTVRSLEPSSTGGAASSERASSLAVAGSVAAYGSAVVDALRHLGVRQLALPMTSGTVWDAVAAAEGTSAG